MTPAPVSIPYFNANPDLGALKLLLLLLKKNFFFINNLLYHNFQVE